MLGHFERSQHSVYSAVFSADGRQLQTASLDWTAKVWSAPSGECLLTLSGHRGSVYSAVFSADGQQVLTASDDQTATVWSAPLGECLLTMSGHRGCVDLQSSRPRTRPVGADRFRRQCRECDQWTFITRGRIRASLQLVLKK